MGTNYSLITGQHIGKMSRINGQTVFIWAVDPVRFIFRLAELMEEKRALGRPDDPVMQDEYATWYSAFETRTMLASDNLTHDYVHIGEEFS